MTTTRRTSEPTTTAAPRAATRIDEIAERYLDESLELSPIFATYLGAPGHDGELDDFSPAGHARASELRRATLEQLRTATPVDAVDEVTLASLTERLELGHV